MAAAQLIEPPNRTQRQRCWETRDAYYACLDALNVTAPGDEGGKCGKEVEAFKKTCAASWVSGLYTYLPKRDAHYLLCVGRSFQ